MQPKVAAHVSNENEATFLRDVAYRKLLSLIMTGALPAGSALQERRLATALGLSRTPVREAMARCQSEGLITFNKNRSPSVCKLEVTDFVEILKVRKLLECEAARAAAYYGVSDKVFATVRKAIGNLLDLASPTSADHWYVDDMIHDAVAEASDNRLLTKNIQDVRRRTRIFDIHAIPSRLVPGAAEHRAILDAIESRDPHAASAAMGRHIDNVKTAIVEKIIVIGKS